MEIFPSHTNKSQLMSSLALIGLLTVIYWLVRSSYFGKARKLRKIPSVGSTLPLFSLLDSFKFVKNAQSVVEDGTRKWPGRIFKVPTPWDWWLVVSDPKFINEVQKAPEHILSATANADELFQTRLNLGPHIIDNPYHVLLVKGQLTRGLPNLIPDIHDEIVNALNQYIPATNDWCSIKASENMRNVIARATNRVFVGTSLCRNTDWINVNIDFTKAAAQATFIMRLSPSFLRPLVNFFTSKVSKHRRDACRLLEPVVAARRKERMERGDNYPEKPQDFLTWLMDEAKGEEASDAFLVTRLLAMNFASIHTSSLTLTQALIDLASFPEYIQALRDEVQGVTTRDGWRKAAIDQMHKMDSFIKESQRLRMTGTLTMGRKAMTDYTFSDGTEIGAGTLLFVSRLGQFDPNVYDDPLKFDGFRFIKMKERAVLEGHPDKKFDIVTTGVHSLGFGHGRHACPGRFFVAAELKMILAHVVMTYDVKLATGVRPSDKVFMQSITPDHSAEVLFRQRRITVK